MSVYVEHTLKLTYDDLRKIPEDDPYRHELYDGIHVSSPSPMKRHQDIVMELSVQLYRGIKEAGLGSVYAAPFDVELSPYDVFEPDIVVVLNHNRQVLTDTHIVGAPDLVVEVLSPSTERRDRTTKRERYEHFAVPEYWIIDPADPSVEVYRYDAAARTFGPPVRYARDPRRNETHRNRRDRESDRLAFDAGGTLVEIDVHELLSL